MTNEERSMAERLASVYINQCEWEQFLYEDKSEMSFEIQKERPSSIPENIKLGFMAGYTAACESKRVSGKFWECRTRLEVERARSAKLASLVEVMREAIRGTLGHFALLNEEGSRSKWPKHILKCEKAIAEYENEQS